MHPFLYGTLVTTLYIAVAVGIMFVARKLVKIPDELFRKILHRVEYKKHKIIKLQFVERIEYTKGWQKNLSALKICGAVSKKSGFADLIYFRESTQAVLRISFSRMQLPDPHGQLLLQTDKFECH